MPKKQPKRGKPSSGGGGFYATLQKSKKDAAKRWEEAKKAKDQFKTPDIPAGVYMARLNGISQGETSNNKAPFIAFQFTVIRHPEWKGTPLSILHTVEERKTKDGEVWLTEQEALDNISVDLQRLGIETEELEGSELDEAIADLAQEKPVVQLRVKRTKKDGVDYVNTRILKLVDEDDNEEEEDDDVEVDDEDEEGEEEADEAEEEDGEDDEDDADDDSESDEEEEGEDEEEGDEDPPEIGDIVKYKAPRARKPENCTVTSVNVKAETVNLTREKDDKEFKKVPWSELEYEYEE